MRPHQLKALIAAAEQGSIRAAARSVFLSQAALTKALKELEDEMDIALITRSAQGVHLTEAGRLLYARANAIVAETKAARDAVERLKGGSMGSLRAAISPLPAVTILPAAYEAFRRRMPGVSVDLAEGNLQYSLPRLREGALDFVVAGAVDSHASQAFADEELCTDEIVIVCRRGHPLEGARHTDALLALDWIAYSANTDYVDLQRTTLADNSISSTKSVLRCSSMALVIPLLVDTDAVAFLPQRMIEPAWLASILTRIDVPFEMPRLSIRVFTRRHSPISAPAQLMIDCLRDAARRSPGASADKP